MIKRPFFGFGKPKYAVVEGRDLEILKETPLPPKVTLFLKYPGVEVENLGLKTGDKVRTGQKLTLADKNDGYFISTATGTISDISEYTGYLGQKWLTISIDGDGKDQWDDAFNDAGKAPTPENALEFLSSLPGNPDFGTSLSSSPPLDTLIISGFDKDLLISANQFIMRNEVENLMEGIACLKKIAPGVRIIIVVPPGLTLEAEKAGAELKALNALYPDILPEMIMKDVLGRVTPPGGKCRDAGVGVLTAESVAALAKAYGEGRIPIDKIVTVIKKDGTTLNVKARIGAPVGHVLSDLGLETDHGDRLVLGGPMTGKAVYSLDTPIMPDTDALMVQDKEEIQGISDSHCINCGECVRACPAKVPVNMLVRLLENGLYEEAAEQYDLFSCIECGICSFVCMARIPLFHYIMLGKFEFARSGTAEGSDA
jgi:electron transport complex protein RnfC